MKKLPLIHAQYWALILSATTMGETAGDLISQTLNLGYADATLILLAMFILSLLIAILSKTQSAFMYWLVITIAGTLGTTISDYVSRTLGLGYLGSTLVLVGILCILFLIWKWMAKGKTTFDGMNKTTEFLYWMSILISSTLGTALGDLLAHNTPLGFGGSSIFLLVLLLIVIALTIFTNLSREICYWLAIVITHPIGATLGDFMTKEEGLNLGNSTASGILVLVFIVVIFSGKWLRKIATSLIGSTSLFRI